MTIFQFILDCPFYLNSVLHSLSQAFNRLKKEIIRSLHVLRLLEFLSHFENLKCLFSVSQFIMPFDTEIFYMNHNNNPFWYSNLNTQVSKLATVSPLTMLLCPFDIIPVLIKFLLYGIIYYSITFFFLCSSSESNHFLRDPWFVLVGIGRQNWRSVCQEYSFLLRCYCFQSISVDKF